MISKLRVVGAIFASRARDGSQSRTSLRASVVVCFLFHPPRKSAPRPPPPPRARVRDARERSSETATKRERRSSWARRVARVRRARSATASRSTPRRGKSWPPPNRPSVPGSRTRRSARRRGRREMRRNVRVTAGERRTTVRCDERRRSTDLWR